MSKASQSGPSTSSAKTEITGSVFYSNVLTAAGDIILNGTPLRGAFFSPDDRVLFASADWDLLEISGIIVNNTTSGAILRTLDLELRLLLAAIPPEGCVVLPPTYYYESVICRVLFDLHRAAIESGHIRVITEYTDLREYLDKKRERYQKAAHFDHYRTAYYEPDFPDLSVYPFRMVSKSRSIGQQSLQMWSSELKDSRSTLDIPPHHRNELEKLCSDTEKPAFLWENVAEHIERLGINPQSFGANQLRVLRTRLYLASYSLNGIAIPCGSDLLTDVLIPGTAARHYNLRSWRSVFEIAGLLDLLVSSPVDRILKLKAREGVALAIAQIRANLGEGVPSDEVVLRLKRQGMLRKFKRAFTQT